MTIPLKSFFTVFNAISATTTARIPRDSSEMPEHANSLLLEVVGASTPSWTLDIQGRTSPNGTFTALDYVQTWQAGAAALANAQLSITDTTRRFYLIPNCPPFMQLIATRTTGTLTVHGAYTSEVYSQQLITTTRGSVLVEGPVAKDAVIAGNPVQIGGYAVLGDAAMPTQVSATGDIVPILLSGHGQVVIAGTNGSDGSVQRFGFQHRSLADGDANNDQRLLTGASPQEFNGSTYDRRRNVVRTAYLASAARTATTNGSDRTNYNFRGLTVFVNITSAGTLGITPAVQIKDDTSGNYVSVYTAAAAINSTGQRAYNIRLAAENTEGWTETFLGGIDAKTYRVIFTHGDTVSITYSSDVIEMV